ncbi:DNA-binding protein [Streptomyces sp. C11-1]|uniref:DNA-binding protein n=1 Tax=Streptomyces durocortorensis TaxID=2811104 RepID=A0ABY9W6D8_9ACTN|nr:DNA-binding protein [Streptomyces durocortorensis]WNF31380.1 DNA-binding protein [Streptomyces durocortorensis]
MGTKGRAVVALVQTASEEGVRVATSAMTILEADYERIHPARVKWVLSRVDVHDVTKEIADRAAVLLRTHHLHGHEYAIDAALAAITRNAPRPVTVLTSDPEDLALLCGPSVEVVKV